MAVGGVGQEMVVFKSGKSTLNVYRSQYAGTNKATAAMWEVGEDVDNIVRELKGQRRPVRALRSPGMSGRDIHVIGKIRERVVRKDPDGNILSIVNG
jgi:hypothetical protein